MRFGKSTPVVRSWSNTLNSLLFALAMIGLGGFVLYENWGPRTGFAAAVLLLFGLLALWAAISGSYTGNCPVCGAPQKRVSGLHRCRQCLAYGEVVNKEYWEIETDRVAKNPVFAILLAEQWKMPKLCCACGAVATRCTTLRIIRKEFAFDLDAPYCGLHTRGADLDTEYSLDQRKHVPVLKVSSYGFYREFVKANGLSGNHAAKIPR
jgi:hypothetical protein